MNRPLQLGLLPRISGQSVPEPGRSHRVAGLFAGIGGLERGLCHSGHETLVLCENYPPAMEVLRRRFANVPLHADVCSLSALPDDTSLLAAGFPCQDLSQAGQTRGIDGSRSSLVGEVFRLIESHRVPWVLLENVPFMLQLGRGRAMDVIAAAFERLGYAWGYRIVDSRAFGLPQRRKRVYFVASREGDPRTVLFADEATDANEQSRYTTQVACGFYWTEGIRGLGWAVDAIPTLKGGSAIGIPSSPAILLPDGRVVLPDVRDAERLQGFPADWTQPAETVSRPGMRWKLIGNAVSVPVSEWIGCRLANPGTVLDFEMRRIDGMRWPSAAWNVGTGRTAVDASQWPVQREYESLEGFMRFEPKPLSGRAARGFLNRTARSSLRFPAGFLEAVAGHRLRMEGAEPPCSQPGRDGSRVAEPPAGLYA